MASRIHSRATGRSGPKTRTGCITCRKRKVRCDEAKPVCANCTRLRLCCSFLGELAPKSLMSPGARSTRRSTNYITSSPEQEASIKPGSTPIAQSLNSTNFLESTHSEVEWEGEPASGIGNALPSQHTLTSSIDPSSLNIDLELTNELLFGELSPLGLNPFAQDGFHKVGGVSQASEDMERLLLEHFTKAANPISVLPLTHTEWASARRNLLMMANDSACLSAAIYAVSALHMYTVEGKGVLDQAFDYYHASSTGLGAILDHRSEAEISNGRALKQAFATLFLLSHLEVRNTTIPLR